MVSDFLCSNKCFPSSRWRRHPWRPAPPLRFLPPIPSPGSSAIPITVAALQHIKIRSHVPIQLDYGDTTFSAWSAFFDATFRKFGLIDYVDGTVDAQNMWHNVEWLQINQCIVSWLYTSVTSPLMQMVQVPQLKAYLIWCAIRSLLLDNADQLYAL
jgi:hypothetical protein